MPVGVAAGQAPARANPSRSASALSESVRAVGFAAVECIRPSYHLDFAEGMVQNDGRPGLARCGPAAPRRVESVQGRDARAMCNKTPFAAEGGRATRQ